MVLCPVRRPPATLWPDDGQVAADPRVCQRTATRSFPGPLLGMKPPQFAVWMFGQLGARAGDELVDLYPGLGAITEAWRRYTGVPRVAGDVGDVSDDVDSVDEQPFDSGRSRMTRRSRIVGFGSAALLVVAGPVCAAAFSPGLGEDLALVLINLGAILAVSLVFLEVGFSEDRERAREDAARRREREDAAAGGSPRAAKLVASLAGRTITLSNAALRLDPALLECNGEGAARQTGCTHGWSHYTCTQTVFQGGVDHDVTFDVVILSATQLRIKSPRNGPE
jgi:hypothetical protein